MRRRSAPRRAPSRARAPLVPIALAAEERRRLRGLARGRGGGQRALALRARIVLDCSSGRSNRAVARHLRVTAQTVGKWRSRFLRRRLAGLSDEPRSGAPRSISDALIQAVVTRTLHDHPPDAARWSSRRLARELGISQRAVLRIWRAFEL